MADSSTTRVLFDVTRMLARADFSTPTGIDRVDIAYFDALRANPAAVELQPVVIGRHGLRLPSMREMRRLTRIQSSHHSNDHAAETFDRLRRWLLSPADGSGSPPLPMMTTAVESAGLIRAFAAWVDRERAARSQAGKLLALLKRRDAPSAVYLNTSHGQSFRPSLSKWLKQTGVPSVFFVHDLLPLEFPRFNRPREPGRHRLRIETASRLASHVMVNSEATRDDLMRYLKRLSMRAPPITVLPLGIEPQFSKTAGDATQRGTAPYFVVLGTIEPRKNHALLLDVWDQLQKRGSPGTRLVIVGRRGWQNQAVFERLDRGVPGVIECSGLPDETIAKLMRGACALLAPSFCEGYDLPVVEARALGIPVLCSDIPVHREVGGDVAEYLDPADPPAWTRAIADRAARGLGHEVADAHYFAAPRWQPHLDQALTIVIAAARAR